MKSLNKKGFTIVELVIVIAVIAVLAAVLVPVITNVVNKANVSADTQLIKNLNTALATDSAEGNKHYTMSDALDAAEEFGYDVAKINTKADDNQILWDSVADAFCYLDGDDITYTPEVTGDKASKDVDLWIIASQPSEKYSTYLYGASLTSFDNVKTGIDVGNENIDSITYVGGSTAQSVVINTNGGTLTINAGNDTVTHYGEAEVVDVKKTAQSSYHENGTVALIKVKEGHVDIESKADVNGVYIYNDTNYNDDGSVETTAETFAPVKITIEEGVEQPKLSRSAVSINETTGTKVCTIVNGSNAEDYYLFKQGVYEQVKVVDAGKSVTEDSSAKWANTTSNDNIKSAATQIANELNGTRNATTGKIEDQNITALEENYTVTFNEETRDFVIYKADDASKTPVITDDVVTAIEEKVVADGGKSAEEAEKTNALKGSGTLDDPYMVYSIETIQKISDFYDSGYCYFAIDKEKVIANYGSLNIDCTGWTPVCLNGSFNGNGVSFTNVTACLFQNVGYKLNNDNITLKNFSAALNISATQENGSASLVRNIFNAGTTTFDSVNVSGTIESYWNVGSFYNYGTANYNNEGCDYTVNFVNCHSTATLICTSGNTCGGFLGHVYEGAGHTLTLNVDENSEYTGTIYTTSGSGGHYIALNSNETLIFNGVEKSRSEINSYDKNVKIGIVNPTLTDDGYTVSIQSGVSKVRVAVTAQLSAYESDNTTKIQNLTGITMVLGTKELTDVNSSTILLDKVTSATINNSASEYGYSINNGNLAVNVASNSNYREGYVRITVTQYDASGNVICCGTANVIEIKNN